MTLDSLQGHETQSLEERVEQLAHEGEPQVVIDEVAYDGYDDNGDRMRFLPVTTYHEGTLHLGGDINANTIPLNNGQIVVIPRNENADATVLRVETNKGRFGRARPVLGQYHINGAMGPDAEVIVDEKQPLGLKQGIDLDVDQLGFVKAVDLGSGPAFHSPAAQKLMEQGELTPQQKAEFGLVGASLRALEDSGLFVR